MNPQPSVSLRKVAAVARVSLSTVSYALRNDPRLLPETRERIQAIARDLGYRPNPIYSAMMIKARQGSRFRRPSGQTIAYLSGFSSREAWNRAFPQVLMFAGARARAEALNFHLEPFFYREKNWSDQRLEQVLLGRGIRGVIVGPFDRTMGELKLDWSHFAAATIGFTLQIPDLHRVTSDHFHNTRLTISSAQAAGFQRIGCVLPRAISRRIDQQWMAAAMSDVSGDASEQVPLLSLPPEDWRPAPVLQWYRKHRPDFIVTRRNDVADWLGKSIGSRCPPWAELSAGPEISADGYIDEHSDRIGAFALDLVISQLQHNDCGVPAHPTLTLLPGEWHWRTKAGAGPRTAAVKRR